MEAGGLEVVAADHGEGSQPVGGEIRFSPYGQARKGNCVNRAAGRSEGLEGRACRGQAWPYGDSMPPLLQTDMAGQEVGPFGGETEIGEDRRRVQIGERER